MLDIQFVSVDSKMEKKSILLPKNEVSSSISRLLINSEKRLLSNASTALSNHSMIIGRNTSSRWIKCPSEYEMASNTYIQPISIPSFRNLLILTFVHMYPIPPNETLVETKICRHCQTSFPITDKDMEFYEKVSPTFGSPPDKGGRGVKKFLIPPPTLCPDCRQQRRLSFRNERKLYKRKCDATGKDIVSIYSPDKPFKVYHQDYWWSDAWDPMDYGREFDFERSAMEQMGELLREVPRPSLLNS